MFKKCLIIQPIIPHYRIDLFSILSNKFPKKIYFGYDMNCKKLFKNDKKASLLQSIQISWINFGSFIFNPQYIFLFLSKFEIIIFNDNVRCLLLLPSVVLIRLFTNKKVILWGHGYGTNNPLTGDILRKILYFFVHEYIAYSNRGLENIRKISSLKKISVATNTMDLSLYLESSKKYFSYQSKFKNNKKRKFKFLFISRIESEKKPLYALQIINELIKKGYDIEFKVIGSGSLEEEFCNNLEKLNLQDKVNLYGSITCQNKIISIARDCDFLLHPGVIGLTALVSLSLGIPVVTTPSLSQMPEFEILKNNFNAIFLEESSLKSNVSNISNYLNQESIINMRLNSYASISKTKKYDVNYMAKVFKDILERYDL